MLLFQYGPTFAKGGHKEHAVYHVRERRFISPWCKHSIVKADKIDEKFYYQHGIEILGTMTNISS